MSIIEIAEKEASAAGAVSVSEVVLEIGTQSGIEFEALETSLEMAVKGTLLEKAKIQINKISAQAKCIECSTVFMIKNLYDPCPSCNSIYHQIISGKELKVKSIVVETGKD